MRPRIADATPGEAHSGLNSAVRIDVKSPFHRNEQQSQINEALYRFGDESRPARDNW